MKGTDVQAAHAGVRPEEAGERRNFANIDQSRGSVSR